MDMSAAALPPPAPRITDADRRHPLFRLYDEYRRGCQRQLIRAEDFQDWLTCRQAESVRDQAAQHPRFPEFQAWMRSEQGGARRCPAGDFPANFQFWLGGGRW